ncbi:hypothetical protein Tco_1049303 [Tanacetum coccineum]
MAALTADPNALSGGGGGFGWLLEMTAMVEGDVVDIIEEVVTVVGMRYDGCDQRGGWRGRDDYWVVSVSFVGAAGGDDGMILSGGGLPESGRIIAVKMREAP